tara:strand:+ start:226 stop:657 length:432 start_codon:yes stop_codon:yes gene_type:complete
MRRLTYILIVILLFACKKDDALSLAPTIEYQSISPLTAQEYIDDIIITISYTDEDGDLGENSPDIDNLFIEDSRNGIVYHFRIPQLAPNGYQIDMQGIFNITINGSGITNSSNSQQVNYVIYVKDRAGNKSNTITTPNITIQQ